jgi:hypothetical protein
MCASGIESSQKRGTVSLLGAARSFDLLVGQARSHRAPAFNRLLVRLSDLLRATFDSG